MAGVLLGLWSGAVWWGAGRSGREHAVRAAMAIGLAASMAMQIMLLWLDGQLTLQTGLPLHLCGLFGVLSIPMLLWRAPQPLYELSAFLAGPAAAVTLLGMDQGFLWRHDGLYAHLFPEIAARRYASASSRNNVMHSMDNAHT